MNFSKPSKAFFLDRDGTLIKNIPYLKDPNLVTLLPGCSEALREMKAHHFRLIVVTNQSGIGRGLVTEADVNNVHKKLQSLLQSQGAEIDQFYFCPHLPPHQSSQGCQCRKPKPKLFEDALHDWNIDPSQSFTIGDSLTDLEAGHHVGTKTIFFETKLKNFDIPEWVSYRCKSWLELLPLIDKVI